MQYYEANNLIVIHMKKYRFFLFRFLWYFLSNVFAVGKALASSNSSPEIDESSLVVCFGEMLIDFVPTTNGLSLAEAPAFKKAPGGAPANVAVGISRLGGSSAFIGKVLYYVYSFIFFE